MTLATTHQMAGGQDAQDRKFKSMVHDRNNRALRQNSPESKSEMLAESRQWWHLEPYTFF
jgi:hypothetical protein